MVWRRERTARVQGTRQTRTHNKGFLGSNNDYGSTLPPPSSGTRLGRRKLRQFGRHGVRRIRREIQFQQRHERHAEFGLPGRAINERDDGNGVGSVRLQDIQALLRAAAAGDDVFGDDDPLAGTEGKITSQHEFVVFFFNEDETYAELAGDFLADDESAHRRSEDGVTRVRGQFRAEQFNQARDLIHVLANLGALEEMAAVETRAQDEVSSQEGL